MPEIRRDVRFGRISFVTLEEDASEALGDALSIVGGGIVPGERSARPFNLVLPVRGDGFDPNPYSSGDRLRRQLRSLMENPKARMESLYFRFFVDQELNGWIIAGAGDMQYGEGGVSLADYVFTLSDTYRIGTWRTHRAARSFELYDRRLSSTPRDYLGTIYSTDFSSLTPLAQHFIPPGYSDVMLQHRVGALPLSRPSIGGSVGILTGRPHSEVVSYEQAEDSIYSGADVVVFDRRGILAPTETIRTNLFTNPSGETGTTGWTAALARDGTYRVRFGRFSIKSIRTAGGGDSSMASAALTVAGSGVHTISVYVLIPDEWDGTALSLTAENYAGATGTLTVNADLLTRGRWQRLTIRPNFAGGDLVGNIVLRATGSSAGSALYVDAALAETGSVLNEYFDGDAEWSDWTGAVHASTSRWYGDPEDYGWEEVYGIDFPFSFGDVPVVQNGICRVRQHATLTGIYMVDSFVAGTGWQEQGGIEVRRVTSAGTVFTRYDELRSARVCEWTPERTVICIVLGIAAEPGEHCHVYITLQRGWTGPRVEGYGMTSGATMPGVEIVWYPFESGTTHYGNLGFAASDDPSFVWTGSGQITGAYEPWSLVQPAVRKSAILGLLRIGLWAALRVSTTVYGSNRNTVSYRSHDGTALAGYASVHFGFAARGAIFEAEAHDNAGSGTSTVVTDAAAFPGSGSSAINETQAANTANTIIIPSATLVSAGVGEGVLGVWARVRVVTGGATGQAVFAFSGEPASTAVPFTSSTYVWVFLGAQPRGSGDTLAINLWRSAGSGDTRIDRVFVAPLERRAAPNADLLGNRDIGLSQLLDAQQVPTIVSR